MESGRLRHSIEIQAATKTDGAAGNPEETWATIATCRASIRPLRGREFVEQFQVNADLTHEIRIRYFDGLTSKHRILFGNRIFHLVAPPINVNERNREHILMCKESF